MDYGQRGHEKKTEGGKGVISMSTQLFKSDILFLKSTSWWCL